MNNTIQVSRNNMVYFSVVPRDGIFEIDLSNSNTNDSSMYAVSNKKVKSDLDSALLWHCRLGHISKKCIEKLQHDRLLNSTDLRAFEKCVSCMSGKMARKPYTHQVDRAKDLLGLIHTDEVENQLGKTIKSLRSDHRGEYMSQEFLDHLKDHGIIAYLKQLFQSPFGDYALETTACILNMVPTKKVEKTPYEPDKLEPRSIKCIFVGYPKETMFENKVLVIQNAEFLKNSLITQEANEPQSDIIPILRSIRTRHAPDHMCLYVDAEEHELGDLGEPANYKAALLDAESDKWLNAMNMEMQSIKNNEVWDLVDLLPNRKIVGSKWLFKKKTDMDGAVYTYKAHLVAKGFTQTYDVDYKETFSPVVDIRAIRILIAIPAYYDYEICQMDVKTAFLNGHLLEEVYMEQPKGEVAYILGIKIYKDISRRLIGLCQSAYIEKTLKRFHMENSKRGSIPMQENLRLSKSQGASTPAELKRMQNVPYASANPSDLHWTTVKNILKYLRNTKDMFLVYGGDIKRELKVSCYTDVGYLTDADDLKSQTKYVFVLNGGFVDWKSAKQNIFATSSAEAEYIAAYDASKEAVWVRKFISVLAKESGITKGTRHFHAKVHYLREAIEYSDIKLEKVHTDDNLDDPFTKASTFPKHSEHTKNIRMLPASSLM
ncbi:retrotransposon protein, putative, ty1-copia subclass [Tanacetum coccineum]